MKTVVEFLEASQAKYPDKIAVIDESGKCSYRDLQERAQQIGSFLISRTDSRQSVVCLMDKSIVCLQAFMGIAYAGCFYTLLDPSFPKDRIDKILSVLTPQVILTTFAYRSVVEALGLSDSVTYIEDIPREVLPQSLAERRKNICDTDPLYCNFIS